MFKILSYLSILGIAVLFARVEDHFKPAAGKFDQNQIRNIDFLYCINLDQRPEKFKKCVLQLALYGITPYRFSAVNGWQLSLDAINDVGVRLEPWMSIGNWGTYYENEFVPKHEPVSQYGRNYFCHTMSRGAIGITLSHLSVLQDAYDSNYQTIWVIEDDIDILDNPHSLSDLIDELDSLVGSNGWDVLFTDPDTKNYAGEYVPSYGYAWKPNYFPENTYQFSQRFDVSSNLKRIGARFGAYSMIIRRSGMEKILNYLKKYHIFLPYDIEYVFPPGIRLYSARQDIVSTQSIAPTDNGAPNYEKK